MTIEQCARELADLLKSGELPPPHQVSALINSCLRGVGVRQMDVKRHQLAVAFSGDGARFGATRDYSAENTAGRSLMRRSTSARAYGRPRPIRPAPPHPAPSSLLTPPGYGRSQGRGAARRQGSDR